MEQKWFERTILILGVIALGVLVYAGTANGATVCQIGNGCTGTSTAPAYGKVLVGGLSGEYEYVATSTFGTGGASAVDPFYHPTSKRSATTTELDFYGNASSTEFEASSTAWFDGPTASSLLALDNNHQLIASSTIGWNLLKGPASSIFAFDASGNPLATTSIGTNYITGALGTINTVSLSRGGSITITAASSTLLGDSSAFSGNNVFTASTTFQKLVNLANASSSLNTFATVWNTGITSALVSVDANHKESAYGGASACSSNNFVTTISALGATTCGTASISGVNLGSNLNSLSHNSTLSGTSYNGSAAVSDWTINLGNVNAWTALQTFTNASSSLFSAYTSFFGGTATDTISTTGTLTLQDADNAWSGIDTPTRNLTLTTASTTWGTGTTSNPQVLAGSIIATFAGTIKTVQCLASTTNAFLGVTPFIGSTAMTPSYFVASNTVGTISFTGNNTFTSGQQIGMYVGTSTAFSGNSGVVCTFRAVQTS